MRRRTLNNSSGVVKAQLIQYSDTFDNDVVFYDSATEQFLYYRFGVDGEDIIPNTCNPIGVIVITYLKGLYEGGASGVIGLKDLGNAVWGNTDTFITENITKQYAGKEKTQAIIDYRGTKPDGWTPDVNNPDDFPAASLCNLYSTPGTNQGDWYLPSSDEFELIYPAYLLHYGLTDDFYEYYPEFEQYHHLDFWYSSEYNNEKAKYISEYYNVYTESDDKTNSHSVFPMIQIGAIQTNYGDILISGGNVDEIPASGGSSQVTGYTYSQTYGYGDSTTNGGVITSGADVSVTSVSGDDLVDNETERVKKGDSVLTITMNGKTVTKSYPVYQEANVATYGDIVVKNSGTASVIPASGGSSTASGVVCEQTVSYTSKYSKKADISYGNYTTVSVGSLGTTEKTQSVVGNSVVVVTGGGGKQIEVKVPVYQQENKANVTSAITSYGTPTVSIGSGITCAGGSATVSHSVTNTRTYYYTSNAPGKTENVAGTTTIKITTNGNSRFSLSGNTLTHSNMTTNEVTDSCTITATNSGNTSKTKTATVSVTNSADASSKITAYGTPTVSIGSGITCAGGSATVSHSVTNTRTYYYCSGSAGRTESVAGTTTIKITTNGNSRFSLSGNTLTHSNMTTNEVTDSCTITATNSGDTSKTKTATVSVTNNADASSAITAYGTPTVSIGSGITCAGGSATVSHSVTNTRTYYYCSGSAGRTESVAGTTTIKITTNGNSRFSLSGNTLTHSNMTTNAVTDSCTITATNSGDTSKTKTATVSVTNSADASSKITAYGTPTVSIGSGITCAGGSATVSHSVTNTRTYYYCSGSAGRTESVAGTTTIKITTNGNSRFSLSGNTLTHSNMTTNAVTDSCTITATNSGDTSKTKTATVSVTNSADASSKITAYGTPTVSIGSGITCSGGSATVSHSVTNTRTYYYCSGSAGRTESVAGTTTIKITSNGNNRFSLSGNTLTHSNMTTNAVTDSCTITATNSGDTSKTKTATVSVTNSADASSAITAYGTPTVSIGSGITCSGGSATITSSVNNTRTYYYCSGSAGRTESVAGTVNLTISHQSFSTTTSKGTNGNISRFSLSGTKLSHTSMTNNNGYDHVTITATNASSTSKTASASTYVRNTETSSKITAYGTPSVSIGSGITCSGGSATVSHSVTNTRTYYYCTGSVSRSVSEAGTTTIKITSNGNSRFSLSGNTLSHSSMGKNEVTDSCTITATNSGDTSKTKTATVSVTNTSTTTYGNVTAGAITNKTIAASGGSATATAGNGSQTWTKTYCTGQKDTGTISVSPSVASISGSASSKGETSSGQTTVKSQNVTWSANGKSASGTMYVYQAANSFSGVTFTTSVSSASISAAGGTITVSGTAKVNWSSGSYSKTPSYRISDQDAGATISGSTIKFPKNTASTTKYAYAQTYLVYNGKTYYDNSGAKKITQDRQLPTNTITAYTPYGGSTTVSVYASSAVGSDLSITVTCHCEDMYGSGSMVTASGNGVMKKGTKSLTVTIERAVTMGYEVTEITNVNVSPLIDTAYQYVTQIA